MLEQLNPEQRSAVVRRGRPLLVLAGAGSGKTKTLTERMASLLAEGVNPAAIAAITFTNKAAREMRQRLAGRVGSELAAAVSVCTFHALGLKLLQIEAAHAGLRSGFSILDSSDSEGLFNDLAPAGMGRDTVAKLRHRVHQAKSAGLRPQAVASDTAEGAEVRRLYGAYQERLTAFNAVDFDDLIVRPLWLLEDHPELAERWRSRYAHLLVDEYQDTNPAQYSLLRILAGDGSGLAVVGDDDQSIYAWRGADPRNLFRLDQDFPSLEVVKLERNYRCAPRILKIANALIANNPHLIEKTLWSGLPDCS
ncbi:MAG: UvrD-helicase domain-containing protein, partial [Xanthomonadales bacterium]|nr:UvrD-helicase domain-containing protein [Xanthomonadales bacterium]